jgi:hypothetical protein
MKCVSCPINEQTADGDVVGRCWHHLKNNICPRHGDVSEAVRKFEQTGRLTLERDLNPPPPIPMGKTIFVCSKCGNDRRDNEYGTLCEDCFALGSNKLNIACSRPSKRR